ncbi:protein LOW PHOTOSYNTHETIC EFFICIENCY 1, chloroplastic-like [Phragmites australis]|uniref:protein LOW PHOTOSYNTHETIC EFFICIENCY 1, chloroplastic-like n=1 Tax=Phragmites australis TaxID=29695 RepID=UPI002D79C142|nr:protein LOW PHOTOSYNTHETIC EFFICIENCY 1, chloroplastic-like [Phragmites australis]
MASSLAAFHSAGHLPRPRRQQIPTHTRTSLLLRLLQLPPPAPPRRRSDRIAAEFATGGSDTITGKGGGGGCGRARGDGGVDVAAVAALLRDSRTAGDVECLVKGFLDGGGGDGHLPLQVYTTVIRRLGKEKRLDAAFAVVEHLKRRGGGGVNQFVYNCLLGAVKNCGEFGRIQGVLADMEAQGVSPNIVTFNTLMSIYVQQGKVDDVFRVYADIEGHGLVPTAATYSTVMSAHKKAGDAFAALNYFVMLRNRYKYGELIGNSDDWNHEFVKFEKLTVRVCYTSMRQSLVNGQNPVGEVLKVLLALDKAGVRLDKRHYEGLVWACTGEEHYTIAKELYQRIRERDEEISLSVCNHLIWLMGKAKKWWAALEIYEDLLNKGPKPNNLSYEMIMSHFNILLSAAKRRGIWRWGVRLLNKMQEKGLKPGSKEWNAVLLACSRASETSAAVDIFKKMIDEGLKPDVVSYGALLSALEKGKLYDEALRVWEHMCKVGIKPNLYAYTILVSIYIGTGNHAMVEAVLHDMLSAKIEPTVVTFNAIISACVRNNRGGTAFEWFHRMKMRSIEPNEITYQMLIEALVQDDKPRLAYEMYMRACNKGLELPAKSYDTVMEACKAYGSFIDVTTLGPRPAKKVETIRIENNFSSFSRINDMPSSTHQFGGTGMYNFYRYRMAR